MAFDRENNQIPTSIGLLQITITDNPVDQDTATFIVQVLDQDGNPYKALNGNLVPHLTPAQITALQSFMAALRTQAENQIIP